MPTRTWDNGSRYRYGFNGKENDSDVKGEGNQLNFDGRIYDPRLGRWLSVDPMAKMYPEESPYDFALNNPLHFIDPTGNSVEPAEQKNLNFVSNAILGTHIHAAAKIYFGEKLGWKGEVTFDVPLLGTGRADLVYEDANGKAAIWEIKPVSYYNKSNGKHEKAKGQLARYKALAQTKANQQGEDIKYSIGTSEGTPSPIKGTASLNVKSGDYNYTVNLFIPEGEGNTGLIYYKIIKAERVSEPSPVIIPIQVPELKPYTGYPGKGIGEFISKGIEWLTGKKIPIPDPIPAPVPVPRPVPAF